jgi:hypothetical protein
MDGCKSPTDVCIGHGWALEHGNGWACVAPPNMVPLAYAFACPCPARIYDWRFALAPQTSRQQGAPGVLEDAETIEIHRWLKRTLACLATSEHASAPLARVYLHDHDEATDEAMLEAFGNEMLRRLGERR